MPKSNRHVWWRVRYLIMGLLFGSCLWVMLLQTQDVYPEWETGNSQLEQVVTPMQTFMQTLGRTAEIELKGLEETRPLFTKQIFRNVWLSDLNISRLVMNREVAPEEVELLHLSSKEAEELNDFLPRGGFNHKHRTCALVGASRQLLQRQHGPSIDSMEAVMRMNEAPVKGYEVHVGRRTTFRAVGAAYLKALLAAKTDRSGRRHPVTGKTVLLYGDVAASAYIEMVKRYPENLNYLLGPLLREAARKAIKQLRERIVGSGRYAAATKSYASFMECLVFMLQVCESLHVFGVDPDGGLYYDKKEVLHTSTDSITDPALHMLLRAMSVEDIIKFH
mmetsp:Transcript_35700/g.68479  ORF Transcript_35700/g.68479 Transcript_35700/m.68479 type:complete len:334 (+) Transcript_35700:162-1163(+)|eukprot:CAMPEP_0114283780 /NCGR_PEP_ID=MMETSP0059-20121206/4291_1 /TAXON_ID=36894 /ORGANISM="Pyramimonas parkeae, Strain CCMP726" /LENGTH=333 /DNA_ID=CAMNT_0001404545 /DNA_START=304 /DNA_END=1305 /DNA_ORIENTATION=+